MRVRCGVRAGQQTARHFLNGNQRNNRPRRANNLVENNVWQNCQTTTNNGGIETMARRNITIDNRQDIIDSRDVIERLEELRDERESLVEAVNDAKEDATRSDTEAEANLAEWDADNGDELKSLESLNSEGESNASDWSHGATLIRETYFVEFCKQDVIDLGDLPRNIPSYLEIDWDKTADNLKANYSTITFGGVDYYVRD